MPVSVAVQAASQELAGPAHLNSLSNAKIAIQAMDHREHSNAALAAAGVREYRNIKVRTSRKRSMEDASAVVQDVQVNKRHRQTYQKQKEAAGGRGRGRENRQQT